MNTCRLFVSTVLLAIVFLASACGTPVTAGPTSMPTQVCSPPSQDGFGRTLAAWQQWDGEERTYSTGAGSQFHLRYENELIVELTPLNPAMPRAEILRHEMPDEYLAVVPLGTNVGDEYYVVNGPIYLYRCGETIWINDEFKDDEIIIPIDTETQEPQA